MEPGTKAWLDGYLKAYDDLPDGAWEAACVAAIERARGMSDPEKWHIPSELRNSSKEPYDLWLEWATQ